MKLFICKVCGHIAFNNAPERCPVCLSSDFIQNDNIFKESEEKSKEAAIKHIPSVTIKKECGLIPDSGCLDVIVRIGKAIHPMEEKHFIQFIDCYVDNKYIERLFLSPGVYAAGCFHLKTNGAKVTVVDNCNIHGYWMMQTDL